MRYFPVLLAVVGLSLVGCTQEEEIEEELEKELHVDPSEPGEGGGSNGEYLDMHFGPSPGDG